MLGLTYGDDVYYSGTMPARKKKIVPKKTRRASFDSKPVEEETSPETVASMTVVEEHVDVISKEDAPADSPPTEQKEEAAQAESQEEEKAPETSSEASALDTSDDLITSKKTTDTPPLSEDEIAKQAGSRGFDTSGPTETPRKSSGKFLLWLITLVILGAGFTSSVFIAYTMGVKAGEDKVTMAIEQARQAKPSPTPTQAPSQADDKTTYTITVLNGSGQAGVAAAGKALLEQDGYTVGSVGNASSSDYQETVIEAKSAVPPAWISMLAKDLGTDYTVDSHTKSLDDSESSDIIVIIGQQTAQ